MEEVKKIHFLSFYRYALQGDKSDNPFERASAKRKSLSLFYNSSLSVLSNDGVCQLLADKTSEYLGTVDCIGQKQVNNYADGALAIASASGNKEILKWESQLQQRRNISDAIKKLNCPKDCHKWSVTEGDLKAIAKNSNQTDDNLERNDLALGLGFHEAGREKTQLMRFPSAGENDIANATKRKIPNNFKDGNGCDRMNEDTDSCAFKARQITPDFGTSRNILPASVTNMHHMGLREETDNFSKYPILKRTASSGDSDLRVSTENFSTGGFSAQNNLPVIRHTDMRTCPNRGGNKIPNSTTYQPQPEVSNSSAGFFKTARDELVVQNQKKYGNRGGQNQRGNGAPVYGANIQKRSLGTTRRAGVNGKFVPPVRPTEEDDFGGMFGVKQPYNEPSSSDEVDERLKNIDPKMVELIRNEIMDIGSAVTWDDIAGLDFAKSTIQEIVVWPLLRPDIFTGLRKPPKGLLLFGPPGTGKTLIGKCIASQSQSTFFSISASSLTSKWIGDGEKMVRALFAVAKLHQPSVIFIDEIDSLLTQRSDTEHESSRRIKTEFLVQLDGAGTGEDERLLIVGATNRPQELDEAARRRLVKRLYIPLPEFPARKRIVERLMSTERCILTGEQVDEIAALTEGYSGADMKNLCQEASLGPIRSISFSAMRQITSDQVRPVNMDDFKGALERVRASVSSTDLNAYVEWDKTYGMGCGR